MSADILRRAATQLRADWEGATDQAAERFHFAVAGWLDGVVLLLDSGERAPDKFAALAVARAYLGEGE